MKLSIMLSWLILDILWQGALIYEAVRLMRNVNEDICCGFLSLGASFSKREIGKLQGSLCNFEAK